MATDWTHPASEIPPTGVLTKAKPVTHIRRSVEELQKKCPLRMKFEVTGLTATARFAGNTILVSGQVERQGRGGSTPPEAGGDDTADGDGSGTGDGGGGDTELALSHDFFNGKLRIILRGKIEGKKIDLHTDVPLAACPDENGGGSGGA